MQRQWQTNYKPLAIKMSDGSLLAGKVNIGDFQRLSDFFRETEDKFITLLCSVDDKEPTRVVFVNKSYIIWVEALD